MGTMPFQPVLKIMVEFPGKFMYAWLSPDVNPDELVRQFDGQMRLDEATEGASGSHSFSHMPNHPKMLLTLIPP